MGNQAFRDSIQEKICQNFCSYFKPSKNEDLACMGFLVIERLLKKGKIIHFKKHDKKLDAATEAILVQHMCKACPFYENGCDFVQMKKVAPPCGGFILLAHLLEKNIISIDDIKNII